MVRRTVGSSGSSSSNNSGSGAGTPATKAKKQSQTQQPQDQHPEDLNSGLLPGSKESTSTESDRPTVKRPASSSKAVMEDSDSETETVLEVQCGLNKASIYLTKLRQGSRGPCVFFDDAWFTPNEFQAVSGRETAKDWKRSIKHHGKSLKLLMAKGTLTLQPPKCMCEECTGILSGEEAGGACGTTAAVTETKVG